MSLDLRTPTLELPSILDPRTVEGTRDVLIAQLERGDLVLGAAGVERLSTVGVHLLLAAERSAQAAGRAFALIDPSPAVRDVFAALGLENRLSAWTAA